MSTLAWRGEIVLIRRFIPHPAVLVALAVVTGAAAAAVVLTYDNQSRVTATTTPAPVQFAAGDDAGPSTLSDYVTAYSVSTNGTYFTSTLKGVPEATVVVDSFVKVTNVDDTARTVTLSTGNVTNDYVTAFKLEAFDASNVLHGTVDMKTDAPGASFTLPAGSTFTVKLTLGLASGAGAHNVDVTNAITLTVA